MRAEHRAALRAAFASSLAAVAAAGFVALARAGFCVHQLLGLHRPGQDVLGGGNAMRGMTMPGMAMGDVTAAASAPDACPLLVAAAVAFALAWLVATLVLARRVVAVVAAASRFVAPGAGAPWLPRARAAARAAGTRLARRYGTRAPPLPA